MSKQDDNDPDKLLAQLVDMQKKLDDEMAKLGLPSSPEEWDNFDPTENLPEILIAAGAEDEDLLDALSRALDAGADPNEVSKFGDSLIGSLFRRGRMDAIQLVHSRGADISALEFGPLHRAVAFGDVKDVGDFANKDVHSDRDSGGRSPFLLACRLGELEKAKVLFPFAPKDALITTGDQDGPLHLAAYGEHLEMVEWLLNEGFPVDQPNRFGGTALLAAVENDNLEIVKRLLHEGADPLAKMNVSASLNAAREDAPTTVWEQGARLISDATEGFAPTPHDTPDTINTPANCAYSQEVVDALVEAGAPYEAFDYETQPKVVRADLVPSVNITPELFAAGRAPREGQANPEKALEPFWQEQIRTGNCAHFGGREPFMTGDDRYEPPPVWSFKRFGQSGTRLPDERWVLIAGEHEDHYDPDFCIYNDVTVFDGKGGVEHYLYPYDVFPPTDFHSATLLGNSIILIGSLGYDDHRPEGVTQVLRLSIKDFAIEPLNTTGDNPGWISRHNAELQGDRIIVWGGKVGPDYKELEGAWALDTNNWTWSRLRE